MSRASYGIQFQAPFNALRHLEEEKMWDADEGMWKATGQMSWYLKRVRAVVKLHQIPIPPVSPLVVPSETNI